MFIDIIIFIYVCVNIVFFVKNIYLTGSIQLLPLTYIYNNNIIII